jgi:hypothetical protein
MDSRLVHQTRQRLCHLLLQSDLRGTRFTLAIGAIFIGLGFCWPTQIFPTAEQIASGQGRHTYALMAQIAPEWAWALAFLAQGLIMAWSLLSGYRTKWLLWLDAAFGVVLWTAAIGACYLAYWRGFDRIMDYRPPAIMGGEIAATLASWWVFVRYHFEAPTRQDRRGTDRRCRDAAA